MILFFYKYIIYHKNIMNNIFGGGIEFEAKFLDIDKEKMIKILKDNGAKLIHSRKKYLRSVFHRCTNEVKGYARVRDEGGVVTMTVKTYEDAKFPKEFEVTINDSFETGIEFLKSLGLQQKAYQETYREKWSHPLAHEITFDDIPGIPTYMEIDTTAESKLNELIKMFELDESKMRFGAFDKTYNEYYGIPVDDINNETPFLTFDNIENEINPTKNISMLKNMAHMYKNSIDNNIKFNAESDSESDSESKEQDGGSKKMQYLNLRQHYLNMRKLI
jgi:adenylate cyclase class 2